MYLIRKNKINCLLAIFLFSILFCVNKVNAEYLANDKPLFVIISTNWCYACKMLHPVIEELKKQYAGQVSFLELDASSEETVNASRQLAAQYGLATYFDSNRNVFPKVGIVCPGSTNPEKIIIGANGKEAYVDAINSFIFNPSKLCSLNGRPQETANSPDRPDEPQIQEIVGGRPNIPNTLDRPNEITNSGRPDELRFWTVGQTIPLYAYYQYLLIPKCSANNIICSNNTTVNIQDIKNNNNTEPVFKPYTPNATRDEKGLHLK